MKAHVSSRALVAAVLIALAGVFSTTSTAEADTVTVVDWGGSYQEAFTSLALDAQARPVIAFHTDLGGVAGQLRVVHCGNPSCTVGNTTSVADVGGEYASLALDAGGNPVVSYYEPVNGDLKVLHCNDPNCSGGGESITSPDTGSGMFDVGQYTSLALAGGNPVVSYYDAGNGNLKVLICDDPNCAPGGDSIWAWDQVGDVGRHTSLALRSDGCPVVSYYDVTNGNLKVLVSVWTGSVCFPGASSPDTIGDVGRYTSLALDTSGRPVIAYHGDTFHDLRLLRCGNAYCTSGNTKVIVDSEEDTGYYNSLVLDSRGWPVLTYYSLTSGDLRLLRCSNDTCSIASKRSVAWPDPDKPDDVGRFTSLALDGAENPVVSYIDATNNQVKVLRCGSATCNSIAAPDPVHMGGEALALDASGYPVVAYQQWPVGPGENGGVNVLHCRDPNCTWAGYWINEATIGDCLDCGPGMVLDPSGNPVIAYFEWSTENMHVLHCLDPYCADHDSSNTIPDPGDERYPGDVAVDASGNPVISYQYSLDALRVMHCNDPNCAGGDESIATVDSGGYVGQCSSLELDSAGRPVVSYYGLHNGDLKVARCGNANCTAGNSVVTADSGGYDDVGQCSSLALDASGRPVISYPNNTTGDLKVLHCGNVYCSAGNVITSLDTQGEGHWGLYTSLALDGSGNPVVAYSEFVFGEAQYLGLLHCGNEFCTSGNVISYPELRTASTGSPSLALDSNGNPVVAYGSDYMTHVLHCGDPYCGAGPGAGCLDRLGDTSCENPTDDPDDDGCVGAEELAMGFGPTAWYDFYDVPVPAKPDAGPGSGANGIRDKGVVMDDVLAVLFYVNTYDGDAGDPPNPNGVRYDTIKGVDLDGDTSNDIALPLHQIKEGVKYDRSPGPLPNPPWEAGPPDGAVTMDDVLAALAQSGLDCTGPP